MKAEEGRLCAYSESFVIYSCYRVREFPVHALDVGYDTFVIEHHSLCLKMSATVLTEGAQSVGFNRIYQLIILTLHHYYLVCVFY